MILGIFDQQVTLISLESIGLLVQENKYKIDFQDRSHLESQSFLPTHPQKSNIYFS